MFERTCIYYVAVAQPSATWLGRVVCGLVRQNPQEPKRHPKLLTRWMPHCATVQTVRLRGLNPHRIFYHKPPILVGLNEVPSLVLLGAMGNCWHTIRLTQTVCYETNFCTVLYSVSVTEGYLNFILFLLYSFVSDWLIVWRLPVFSTYYTMYNQSGYPPPYSGNVN